MQAAQTKSSLAPETIIVDSPVVACDGGGGALGHPRVYLNMGDKHEIDCPYCGRQYLLKDGAGHGH
ncbi:MAG: zinc-finger domain-containing protein [Ferrovibrio sp.]|uniref:zinc-finger domain-containing protein n=1 Tax=Ferrovibrio sp. TaxID=1917215 RepID=UPI002603551D|nr:zinc-finger domain-containing protein [Ferrovibrio sp.]MCW0235416.1 zinc-finger domain-containing protein [Ferrovibrio sp.]